MAVNAITDLTNIGGGLIKNIAMYLLIAVACVGIFYATRWIQKSTKKAKSFTIQAFIIDLNGVIDLDMLAFVKSDDTGMLEMIFQTRKTDSCPPIPKHLIKNGYVMLLNYAPGHYCVIDTSKTVLNFTAGNNEISPFNLGMKKYITAKQREIMNKAENKKRKWEQYAPWVTLSVAAVSAVILAAAIFFGGAWLEAKNIATRIVECGFGGAG